MSVLFFCFVRPQNQENGVLMKEVVCLSGCQAEIGLGRAMLFAFPGQPWKLRLHLARLSSALRVEEGPVGQSALWEAKLSLS